MNSNMKKSGLGKYAGVHGVVFKNSVQPAAVSKGVIGKGGGRPLRKLLFRQIFSRLRARRLSLPKIPGFGGFRSKTLPHFFCRLFFSKRFIFAQFGW